MKQNKIICFGEIMLRLTPAYSFERLEQTDLLRMSFAGAESNIATSLAIFQHDVSFVSILPDNPIGNAAINILRRYGVDTTHIIREGNRIGTYFIEAGTSVRPTQVIYDRADSAFSFIKPGQIHWEEVLKDAEYFVLTGITPALSDSCTAAALEAMKIAQKMKVKVCFDFNYRSKLWSRQKAGEVLSAFIEYVNILFCNEGAAFDILGIDLTALKNKNTPHEQLYSFLAKEIAAKGNYDFIALTHRDHHSASDNTWSGVLYNNQEAFYSKQYELKIIDRLGGGDAFAAGIIHGISQGWNNAKTIEFATIAAAIKHTLPGDLNIVSEKEILHVMENDSTGHILR